MVQKESKKEKNSEKKQMFFPWTILPGQQNL